MTFDQVLAAGGGWAVPLAIVGGMIAGLNPCCLAFYPAVTASCCATASDRRRMMPTRAAVFVLGTALATTLLGVAAALAGHAVALLGRGPRYALAFIPILMGLHLIGWLRIPFPASGSARGGGGAAAAFGAGLLLSLVVGSCGTPLLAGILSFAAYKGSVLFGAVLLFVYGLGNGVPLLLVGTGLGAVMARFQARQNLADGFAGVLLMGLGFYLLLRI